MVILRQQRMFLFVDKSSRRWVVQDSDGDFWTFSPLELAWERREPFFPTDETELQRVPDHYRYMLSLPD